MHWMLSLAAPVEGRLNIDPRAGNAAIEFVLYSGRMLPLTVGKDNVPPSGG
jgi:hypothetical protein